MSTAAHIATGEFTVKAARNAGTKPNPHGGTLVKWYVDLVDVNGEPVKDSSGKVSDAYWQRKEGSEVAAGDTVYGTITEGDFGLRFKMEQRPEGSEVRTGSAGSQNAGGKGGWQPESERDPERAARILRQHSQGLALQVLGAMGHLDTKDAPTLHRWIKDWANFFDRDVNEAGEAAKQAQGIAAPRGQEGAAAPLASASPAPASPPAGPTMAEVSQALETAGLHHDAATTCALYMIANLEAPRLVTACQKLTGSDLEAQASALKTAEELTVKGTGEPLPSPSPEDDIPF